jgi:hypothetical protein
MTRNKYPLNKWVTTTRRINGVPTQVYLLRYKERGKNKYKIRQTTPRGRNYSWQSDPRGQIRYADFNHETDLAKLNKAFFDVSDYRIMLEDRLEQKQYRDVIERDDLTRAIRQIWHLQQRLGERSQQIAKLTPIKPVPKAQIEAKAIEKRRITPQTVRALKQLSEGDKEFGGGINLEDRDQKLPQMIVARKGSTNLGSLDEGMQVTFHTHPPRDFERVIDEYTLDHLKRRKHVGKAGKARVDEIDRDLVNLVNRAMISTNSVRDKKGNVVGMEGDITAFDSRKRLDPTLIFAGPYMVEVIDYSPSPTEEATTKRAERLQQLQRLAYKNAVADSGINRATSIADLERRAKQFKRIYIKNYQRACQRVGLMCRVSQKNSTTVPIYKRRTDYGEKKYYLHPTEK